jgi:F-type H+-transporting ATPase subunit delta
MIVASRYAKSLLDLSIEKNQTEAVYKDMLQVKQVCESSKDFVLFLNSPIVKTDKKISTLKQIFDGKLNAITSGFLSIVATKRRESIIPEMTDSFIEQYKTNKHILSAVITSASGLDEATKKQVLTIIKSQSKGEVELIEKIDANVIGGFILKIGDRQLDKTVVRQLANLKKELTNKALN